MHALLHSPVVVRVATFPFFNFKVSSTCGGNPATWFPNWHFLAIRVATWGRKPPETPGNPRKPPKMLPGNPGMIVHGITSSKSIGCVHTQKRVGSNLALTLSALRPTAAKRMAVQDALQKLWSHGKFGGLWAREQLKAWALREAWMGGKTGTLGMNTWIAERRLEVAGGRPTSATVQELLGKIPQILKPRGC